MAREVNQRGLDRMLEDQYQIIFFEYTKSLDQIALGQICLKYKVEAHNFLIWTSTCPIRSAKLQEVQHTRVMELERNRK
jgi:hypothetical protein